MLIQGTSMDATMISLSFWNAKNDEQCTELDLREIDFGHGEAGTFIDLVASKEWKTIKLSRCHGLINDVVTACMSSKKVASFHLQSTINPQTIYALSYGLKYSHSLLHLSLSIDIDSSSAMSLAKALACNTWLETLSLAGSTIQSSGIGQLGFAFRINRTLKRISFDACYLEDGQVSSLLLALQDHPKLKSISLQHNSCHSQGMAAIASLLHYNDLEELDLSYLVRKKKSETTNTKLEAEQKEESEEQDDTEEQEEVKTGEGKDEDEEKEQETPDEDTSPKEDGDQKNKEPEQDDSKDGEKVINTSLKVLQLAGNGLSDAYVQSLMGIFGCGSSLEELNLFGNRVTDFGIRMIIQKLPQLRCLKSLWLGHNSFSPVAGGELLQAIKTNFNLEDINIRTLDDSSSLWDELQSELDYYARLNRGGRRIFSSTNDRESSVPLSLWPLVIERANRIYWGGCTNNTIDASSSHAVDTIFCLLHGPALFENPGLHR